MNEKSFFPLWVMIVALIVALAGVAAGWIIIRGDGSLLRNVSFQYDLIRPNADGDRDATAIEYELSRNATLSIYFEDEQGQRYYFRERQPRGVGDYRVLFSGVVQGYRLPGEIIQGEIIARVLQDGEYTWTVEATDDAGHTEKVSGTLTIADASSDLPEMRGFELDRHVFTPNRDGIDDRVLIQFYLTKEAHTRVFLRTEEGDEYPISRLERDVPPNMPGRHYFDYEGGVDRGAIPPPDGVHQIIAIAEDRVGQKIQVTEELTIRFGGNPMANVISPASGNTLQLSATAIALCDTLTFTITVENYGSTPIRTTGPYPGAVYDSDWNYNRLGWHTESGAWRLGIGYENQLFNYPYRWALGSPETLEEIDGHLYLMPGQRAVVTGGIRLVGPFGERNPQPIWAGLIHEDVGISPFNDRINVQNVLVDLPGDPDDLPPCEEREIPVRDEE